MKKFRYILMLALAFTFACEPTPNNEPVDQTPEFQITSANPMVVSYEGGDFVIEFVSSNPDIMTLLGASAEAEWIRVKQLSADYPNKVRFAVEANEVEKSRSSKIILTYDKEYEVIVNQLPAPEKPKEILSTLERDVDMVMNGDNTLVYADYLGNDYNSDLGVWQFWFLEVVSKQMIVLEVLTESQGDVPFEELYVPTGEFTASDDIFEENALMPGYRIYDSDGLYDGGSWYTELDKTGATAAAAPIASGKLNVELNVDGASFSVDFDVLDDVGNKITGTYSGYITIEDFRK